MDRPSMRPRMQVSQVVIAAGLLAVFGAALAGATSWPPETALYPRVISIAGIVLGVVLLVDSMLGHFAAARRPELLEPPADTAGEPAEDEPAAVFARAGRRDWLSALGWVSAFLAGLVVTGLYATVLVFTVVYLRAAAAAGWVLAVGYAVVASGVLYLGTSVLLQVPVPEGLLW